MAGDYNGPIHIDGIGLVELKKALEEAGEGYKEQLAKLINLMDDITSGDIKGDPADNLLKLFREKEPDFRLLAETIEEAQEYAGVKGKDFATMIEDLKNSSR